MKNLRVFQQKCATIDGVKSLNKEQIFFAWKLHEQGRIKLSFECSGELAKRLEASGM